ESGFQAMIRSPHAEMISCPPFVETEVHATSRLKWSVSANELPRSGITALLRGHASHPSRVVNKSMSCLVDGTSVPAVPPLAHKMSGVCAKASGANTRMLIERMARCNILPDFHLHVSSKIPVIEAFDGAARRSL